MQTRGPQDSDHNSHFASLKTQGLYKAQGHQYASPSKQRFKAKLFLPCPHCGFNDHLPDDCMMNKCCNICGDPTHDDRGHDKVIQTRRGITPSTSQSTDSSSTIKCKTCGSSVHSTSDHDSIAKFKKSLRTKPTRRWVNKKN
jgi:DNA-directed RNA polymerase subunit RPC12/RpoP